MPYFSFILDKKSLRSSYKDLKHFKIKTKYYSKNTKLWSKLNKLNKPPINIIIQKENRVKFKENSKRILFCLPPNIGLGDAIEYGLAIKSILLNNKNLYIGVAHVGKYIKIFKNHFNIKNTYDFISEEELNNYESTFHFTIEIKKLNFQKYNRQNIEKLILKYFDIPFFRKKIHNNHLSKNKNVISIFPTSKSPLRTLPVYIINEIIINFVDRYDIEVFLDKESIISEYIFNNLVHSDKIKFNNPNNLEDLIDEIKKVSFGIFCDSGPLHIAKINNINGILIVSSVNEKNLLHKFSSIKAVQSKYKSNYCNGPCGLVNVFQFDKNYGCYDSLKIKKEIITKSDNLKSLQRGKLKDNYLDLYIKSVNCYKYFDTKKINMLIQNNIDKL